MIVNKIAFEREINIIKQLLLQSDTTQFWLVDTWFFAYWRHQRSVTLLENVYQLNIRRDKRLRVQLSNTQPPQCVYMLPRWNLILGWNSSWNKKSHPRMFTLDELELEFHLATKFGLKEDCFLSMKTYEIYNFF